MHEIPPFTFKTKTRLRIGETVEDARAISRVLNADPNSISVVNRYT